MLVECLLAHISPVSIIGAAAVVSFMSHQGCYSPDVIGPADQEGIGVEVEPPVLQALVGDGFVAVWTDRNLAWGERIQRIEADGSPTLLGEGGHVWIDFDSGDRYRWEGGGEELEIEPTELQLSLDIPGGQLLAHRGDRFTRSLSYQGADLYGLPVALVVERDGEAWLEARCEDGLPCWREEPVYWAHWEQGDLPERLALDFIAEAEEPQVTGVELRLEVVRHTVGGGLAAVEHELIETGRRVLWGDLHAHTNLSGDACEDYDNSCLPWGEAPGSEIFAAAEEAGLDFLALTDHAEHSIYERIDLGTELDSWEWTLHLAAEAEGGPVIPIVGFEWTGMYDIYDDEQGTTRPGGGHRTIVFDGLEPCADFWVGARFFESTKVGLGYEDYVQRSRMLVQPDELRDHLAHTATVCDPVRYLVWFHHTGVEIPRSVDWTVPKHRQLGDTVIEIYSEHGASECYDESLEGCDWNIQDGYVAGDGSVQTALQLGYPLGFVSGTDSHDARPGSIEDEASVVVMGTVDGVPTLREQTAPGGVTGVLAAGDEPGRPDIVDAIELRHTVAASWLFDAVRIVALGQDGEVYLPGDDVPAEASPLELVVEIEDEAVELWQLQLLDPYHDVIAEVEASSLREPIDIVVGDVRYLRVRAWIGDSEQRLWASPFFGVK